VAPKGWLQLFLGCLLEKKRYQPRSASWILRRWETVSPSHP
jgi:hypothetical protein